MGNIFRLRRYLSVICQMCVSITQWWAALLCPWPVLWLCCFPPRSRRSNRLTFSRTERQREGPWLPSLTLLLPWLLAEATLSGLAHRWTSARAFSRRVSGCSLSLSCSLCSHWWCCRTAESLWWRGWEAGVIWTWAWGWTGKWVDGTCPWANLEDAPDSLWMIGWSIDLKKGRRRRRIRWRSRGHHYHHQKLCQYVKFTQ